MLFNTQARKNAHFRAVASARAWHRIAADARRDGDAAEERAALARAYAAEERAENVATSPVVFFIIGIIAAAMLKR